MHRMPPLLAAVRAKSKKDLLDATTQLHSALLQTLTADGEGSGSADLNEADVDLAATDDLDEPFSPPLTFAHAEVS